MGACVKSVHGCVRGDGEREKGVGGQHAKKEAGAYPRSSCCWLLLLVTTFLTNRSALPQSSSLND